ncbi:hypothetical protein Celaphus_00016777 [Cervus elaphus hippelaphus]|uniref:Uncharacterized protein n=1 Tax=Cervus elaphus hippelaphus TaxID=46360 RepID=A0A212C3R7_CEREH|nr:hypothetical protein Celaphus_00016777 [Cervus elaphus hippelaphus]
MISGERGIEYTDLEKEAPWEYEYHPLPSWPHRGEIDFDINFRYRLDEPLVLKDLEAPTDPREKEEQGLEKVPSSLPFLDCQNLKVVFRLMESGQPILDL